MTIRRTRPAGNPEPSATTPEASAKPLPAPAEGVIDTHEPVEPSATPRAHRFFSPAPPAPRSERMTPSDLTLLAQSTPGRTDGTSPQTGLDRLTARLAADPAATRAYERLMDLDPQDEPRPQLMRLMLDPAGRARIEALSAGDELARLERLGVPIDDAVDTLFTLGMLPWEPRSDAALELDFAHYRALSERLTDAEPPPLALLHAIRSRPQAQLADVGAWIERIEGAGQTLDTNDLALLDALASRPELAVRLDRSELMTRLSEIYEARPPQHRAGFTAAARWLGHYDERTPPESVPTLDLLRAALWDDALQDDAFRRHVGELVWGDLNDRTTETGGLALLDERGELSLQPLPSVAVDDNLYGHPVPSTHLAAITSFHLHAPSRANSTFAGPSGALSPVGDLGAILRSGATDAVITLLRVDDDELVLNLDLYAGSSRFDYWIVDLGEFRAPIPNE